MTSHTLNRASQRKTATGEPTAWFIVTLFASANLTIGGSLSSSVLVFIVVSPLVLRDALSRQSGRVAILALIATLACGAILVDRSLGLSRRLVPGGIDSAIWLTLSTFAMFFVIRTAMDRVGLPFAAVAFGLGRLLSLIQTGVSSTNPWKFSFALPVVLITLALVLVKYKRGVQQGRITFLSFAALAIISVVFDYRSLAGMCLLAALLFALTESARKNKSPRSGWADWMYLLAIAAGLLIINWVGTYAALNGLLGGEIQQRSIYQYDATGSLITGGRPEWFASFQLMIQDPFGFGPGIAAGPSELAYAFNALDMIGIGSSNPYVQEYMFGGEVELHSVIADMWARYGITGLLLAVAVLVLLITTTIRSIREGSGSGLSLILGVWAMWSLLFGPVFSDTPLIVLATAAALSPMSKAGRTP